MTDLNNVILMGRLTKSVGDDERSFGFIGNGQAHAICSIAVNRSKKVNDNWTDEVSFFNINIWGKTAENLKPYLTKGTQIVVKGYLKQDRWEKDGKKNSSVSIVADEVRLCDSSRNNSSSNNKKTVESNPTRDTGNFNTSSNNDVNSDFPEDIPF